MEEEMKCADCNKVIYYKMSIRKFFVNKEKVMVVFHYHAFCYLMNKNPTNKDLPPKRDE